MSVGEWIHKHRYRYDDDDDVQKIGRGSSHEVKKDTDHPQRTTDSTSNIHRMVNNDRIDTSTSNSNGNNTSSSSDNDDYDSSEDLGPRKRRRLKKVGK